MINSTDFLFTLFCTVLNFILRKKDFKVGDIVTLDKESEFSKDPELTCEILKVGETNYLIKGQSLMGKTEEINKAVMNLYGVKENK